MMYFPLKALQEAQEKQQLLIKQKLEVENRLVNAEKDLKKVRTSSYLLANTQTLLTSLHTFLIVQPGEFHAVSSFLSPDVNKEISLAGLHSLRIVLFERNN